MIYMNYEQIERGYWEAQIQRIRNLRDKIISRGTVLTSGRIIPEGPDLTLGEGRRLKMAVMFLDISGFSSRDMETELEQNTMLSAMNLFFSEMIKIAEDYGGTVEKNTGDGIMAYFEDYTDNILEGGCKRAIACALTMFAANEKLISPILIGSNIFPFNFRISINYGWVTIANLGAPRRFNAYVAIGTTANVAAKMLQKASAGEIIIGESVRNALPIEWQIKYTLIQLEPSGWVYKFSLIPYNLYKYTGRWNNFTE